MEDKVSFIKKVRSALLEWEATVLKKRLADVNDPQFQVHSGAIQEETKGEFRTGSGEIAVNKIYTPLDIADTNPIDDIGLPGRYPFTRGRDPLGYRAWKWPLHFYTGYGRPEDTNARLWQLYKAGARDLDLALDLPTQLGYGCEHPLSYGEVGKVGVALDTANDLVQTYAGLPLQDLHIGTVGNCIGPWIFAMFYVLGERSGLTPESLKVWLQNDPFKEYNGRGACIFPLQPALELCGDVVVYICRNLRTWEPQYVTTSMLRWGGTSAAQEVGFGLSNVFSYVELAARKGVRIEEVVPKINIHMSADNDILEEVAKFRATRRLWAKLAKERFKTTDPRVLSLRLTSVTSGYRLTAQQPLNNIVRLTAQILGAIFGGVEHIVSMAYDEALALPTLEATKLSSMIKILLHHECFVGNTIDPLGGSYFIESLTNEMEEKARYWYDQVEAVGGAVAATENGYYLKQSMEGMYKQQQEIKKGERIVIGVNKYKAEANIPIEIFMGDPEAERQHQEKVAQTKRERDPIKVEKALAQLSRVAEDKVGGKDVNIVPAMITAVRDNVTIGEIFDVLRAILGEYKPVIVI
jgi:methylmalonyl-CoA mutase N-terminal domain/subunit